MKKCEGLQPLWKLFDTSGFVPRWNCGDWSAFHGWLHILSDIGIWGAYVTIPFVLAWFILRRSDLPFRAIFWLFSAFILASGTTHLMEAIIFWKPVYRLAGVVKLFTALVSWGTVIALARAAPKALLLRSPEALEKEVAARTAELQVAKASLEAEVAERKSAQHQAEYANRSKDEFLASLSHELRTPLNAIMGWSQLLRARDISEEEREKGIEVIGRNAVVQARIIDDLLDISRIIAGKFRLDIQPVALPDVINEALAAVAPAAEAKQIRVQKQLDPQAGPVSGDPARLQQVVWNLVANAVKFTPKGGRVEVTLKRVDSHVEIQVADTGQGIDPAFLPMVFERFRQADASSTRPYGGLGLGLSIVRQIVEMHGGAVRVESAGPGKGATFYVSLPLMAVQNAETSTSPSGSFPTSSPKSADTLAGVRVLVVDDEQDARELIKRVLARRGAHVETAASVAEAIRRLANGRFQVVLSDIGMPGEDGYDLIRSIRSGKGARDLPAAALTAFARPEDRRRALEAGFQMHIAKPVDAGELAAAVASLACRTSS